MQPKRYLVLYSTIIWFRNIILGSRSNSYCSVHYFNCLNSEKRRGRGSRERYEFITGAGFFLAGFQSHDGVASLICVPKKWGKKKLYPSCSKYTSTRDWWEEIQFGKTDLICLPDTRTADTSITARYYIIFIYSTTWNCRTSVLLLVLTFWT